MTSLPVDAQAPKGRLVEAPNLLGSEIRPWLTGGRCFGVGTFRIKFKELLHHLPAMNEMSTEVNESEPIFAGGPKRLARFDAPSGR
jgi:hypothetical protein